MSVGGCVCRVQKASKAFSRRLKATGKSGLATGWATPVSCYSPEGPSPSLSYVCFINIAAFIRVGACLRSGPQQYRLAVGAGPTALSRFREEINHQNLLRGTFWRAGGHSFGGRGCFSDLIEWG